MRAAGQDYLYEGWVSHAAPGQTQSCLCPGLLLTGSITAYWHVWRPAVRGQERWRSWVPGGVGGLLLRLGLLF
jgi:type II secretory pathway component PulM